MHWLLAIFILGVAFLLYLKLMEKRMIYYPSSDVAWTPGESKLAFEELSLRCSDGVTIHGWFVPASNQSRATVLFLHGNAGNISHRVDKILLLVGMNMDVCIVDYHGYGKSGGAPSEQSTYLDAEAAYDWLTQQKKIAPKRIIVWGESLGGGVATYLAAKREVGGLVLESTYTTLPDVGKAAFPFLPTRLLMSTQYDSLSRMTQIRVPILSIHSPSDEVIPYRLGKTLFDAANEPKMFVELEGDHNGGFMLSGDKFEKGIRDYRDRFFPSP
jgi:hypothetical protein